MVRIDSTTNVDNILSKEPRPPRRRMKSFFAIAIIGSLLSACGSSVQGSEMKVDVVDGRIVDAELSDSATVFKPTSPYFDRFSDLPEVYMAEETSEVVANLCQAGASPSSLNPNLEIRGCSFSVDGQEIIVIANDQSENSEVTKVHELLHAWLSTFEVANSLTREQKEFFVRQKTLEWAASDWIAAKDLGSERPIIQSAMIYTAYTESSLTADPKQLDPETARLIAAMDSVGGVERSRSLSKIVLDSVVANIDRDKGEKHEIFDPYELEALIADLSSVMFVSRNEFLGNYHYND